MGVYINMEMPTSCTFCRFNGIYCYAKGDEDVHSTLPCPLVPVPPHGKLIEKRDVFKLIWTFPNVDRQLPVEFTDALYELPTIIPAEEGE